MLLKLVLPVCYCLARIGIKEGPCDPLCLQEPMERAAGTAVEMIPV